MRAALTYGGKDKHLGGRLILCPFKITVVGSSLGSMNSPALGSWPGLQYQKDYTLSNNKGIEQ